MFTKLCNAATLPECFDSLFQLACLPPSLLSSIFSLSSSLFPSSAFLSVSVTTSLNINQTGVGGGEQGTP